MPPTMSGVADARFAVLVEGKSDASRSRWLLTPKPKRWRLGGEGAAADDEGAVAVAAAEPFVAALGERVPEECVAPVLPPPNLAPPSVAGPAFVAVEKALLRPAATVVAVAAWAEEDEELPNAPLLVVAVAIVA